MLGKRSAAPHLPWQRRHVLHNKSLLLRGVPGLNNLYIQLGGNIRKWSTWCLQDPDWTLEMICVLAKGYALDYQVD